MGKLKEHLKKDIQATSLRMKYASALKNGAEEFHKAAGVFSALKGAFDAGFNKVLPKIQGLDAAAGKKLWGMFGNNGTISPTLKQLFSFNNVKYPLDELGKEVIAAVPGTVERVPSVLGGLKNLSLGAGAWMLSDAIVKGMSKDDGLNTLAPDKQRSILDLTSPLATPLQQAVGKGVASSYDVNVVRTLEKIRLSNPERYNQVVNAMPPEALEQYTRVRDSLLGR